MVAFHVPLQFLYFVLDLLDRFRFEGYFITLLCPLLFVALHFFLPGLFVVTLHRIGIAATRHDC